MRSGSLLFKNSYLNTDSDLFGNLFGLSQNVFDNVDLDTVSQTSYGLCYNNCQNAPDAMMGEYGALLTLCYRNNSTKYASQIIITRSVKMFVRYNNDNGWEPWKQIALS